MTVRTSATIAVAAVLIGAVPRLLLAAGLLPPWLTPFVWSDVLYTWTERGLAAGRVPYWSAYFEYPPVDGYLAAVFVSLSRDALWYVGLWTAVQLFAAAILGAAIAPYQRPRWVTLALALQLALFGPINFDLVAVAALLLAVRWERARASLRAVAALAIGTGVKLFPAVALPVLLVRRPGPRTAAAQAAIFGLLVAVVYAPAAGAAYSSLESFGHYSLGVAANFDSFWGLAARALDGMGAPSATPLVLVTTAGLLVTYVAIVRASRTAIDPAAPIALAVVTLLLWTRLFSPQFSLWVLPFFVLVPIALRRLFVLSAADVAIFLTVYPLGLVKWPAGDPLATSLLALLAAAVALRQVVLVAIWLDLRCICRARGEPAHAASRGR